MTACHVLIPQIENSLRYVAKIKGEEPSQLHGDGSQERNGLKGLLDNPLIIEAFGVDIIGNLQALLVDKIYGDLRNQLAHGYVPAGYYNQPPCIFCMVACIAHSNEPYGEILASHLWPRE